MCCTGWRHCARQLVGGYPSLALSVLDRLGLVIGRLEFVFPAGFFVALFLEDIFDMVVFKSAFAKGFGGR